MLGLGNRVFITSETDTTQVQSSIDAASTMGIFIKILGVLLIIISFIILLLTVYKNRSKK